MVMKKRLLCTIGAFALWTTAPALAADLPARIYTKAPPVAAVYDWTGFHVGANGTYLASDARWDIGPGVFQPDGSGKGSGFLGGVQAGYDLQVGSWVFGIEAQGNWGTVEVAYPSVANAINTNTVQTDGFGLVTGRVGYAFDNVLFYAKGGGAVVRNRYDVFDTNALLTLRTASETRWGGAAGVGLEIAFTNNWSFATEYVHAFLGQHTLTFSDGVPYNIRHDVDLVSFHLNYRFGGPRT